MNPGQAADHIGTFNCFGPEEKEHSPMFQKLQQVSGESTQEKLFVATLLLAKIAGSLQGVRTTDLR